MTEGIQKREQLVLDVVQEYLEKNRHFSSKQIVPFIGSRFAKSSININNIGIEKILNSLVEKSIIVEGSKLTRSSILLNSNRRLMLYHIQKNPGVYFNQIVNVLNLTIPVVGWHINVLVNFNCILKVKIKSHEAYFDSSIKPEYYEVLHFLALEKSKEIIEFLKGIDKGITKTKLSEILKMHSNTIKKYIEKLEGFGLILSEKLSNKTLYSINMSKFNKLKNKFNHL